MFSFGNNLRIEIDELPWLFWANILVMLLLLLLFFQFISLGFEDTHVNSGESSSMSRDMTINSINNKKDGYRFLQQIHGQGSSGKVVSSRRIFPEEKSKMKANQTVIVGKTITSTSDRRNNEGIHELIEESSSTSTVVGTSISDFPYNPCSWLELAGKAFLKCLGLDTTNLSISEDD